MSLPTQGQARIVRRFVHNAVQASGLVISAIALNFVLIQLLPGDAAEVYAGEAGVATQESIAALRERFGVDQSAGHQLIAYLTHLVHFDLGFSVRYNAPVAQIILSRLATTLSLTVTALLLALVAGVALGLLMAVWRGRWPDRLLSLIAVLLYSVPGFAVGMVLIVVVSVHLGWLPTDGYRTLDEPSSGLAYYLDIGRHMILPVIASATFHVAIFARLIRSSLIEVSEQDHVRTAWAKGLTPSRVLIHHMLRNALIPLTTMTGMEVGALLGGSVVIETLFGWPGLGRLAYDAVLAREYVVLLGILLITSWLVILVNMLTDIVQIWIDPRIKE